MGTAVVSVTKINAGEGAYNVIPDAASFGGTLRSLSHDHLMRLKRRVTEVGWLSPRNGNTQPGCSPASHPQAVMLKS